MNLVTEYRSALQMCESELIKMTKKQQYRGMEAVYGNTLMQVLRENPKFEIKPEEPIKKFGGQAVGGRSRGRVDIVIEDKNSNVHAIEIKIVQLPREKNLGPRQCLYDIGQITRDFVKLNEAKEVISFDCIIVLHGAFVSERSTSKALLREFHNRMFVDFKTSEVAGELKAEQKDPFRKKQKRLIKQLGLDQPFTQSTDSVRALTSERLGLITIHGPLS